MCEAQANSVQSMPTWEGLGVCSPKKFLKIAALRPILVSSHVFFRGFLRDIRTVGAGIAIAILIVHAHTYTVLFSD